MLLRSQHRSHYSTFHWRTSVRTRFFFSFLAFFREIFYQTFCSPVLWDCMTQMKILHCLELEHTKRESSVLALSCFSGHSLTHLFLSHLLSSSICVRCFQKFWWAFVWPEHIHIRTSSTISNLFFPLWKMRTINTHINKAINYYILALFAPFLLLSLILTVKGNKKATTTSIYYTHTWISAELGNEQGGRNKSIYSGRL